VWQGGIRRPVQGIYNRLAGIVGIGPRVAAPAVEQPPAAEAPPVVVAPEVIAADGTRRNLRFAVRHKLAPYDYVHVPYIEPAYRAIRRKQLRANKFAERTVLDIINQHKAAMKIYLKAIRTHSGLKFGKISIPLCFKARTDAPDEVTVYPNIILDLQKIGGIGTSLAPAAMRGMRPAVFKTIIDLYESEKDDPRKAAKWAAPERVYGKVEKMTVVRFIRKYFPKQIEGMRDDQLRDIGNKISNQFAPPSLIFCERPEQYFEMFTCATGSCMAVTSSSHAGGVLQELVKHGRHSSEWYHWSPQIQGVYTKKDGVVIARGWLLRDDITKPFDQYFGSIYGTGQVNIEAMRVMLVDAGYTVYGNRNQQQAWGGRQLTITEKFYVPPIEHKEKLYMPLAFHDPVQSSYYIAWDEEQGMFECGPRDKAPADRKNVKPGSPYTYGGMMPQSEVYEGPKTPAQIAAAKAKAEEARRAKEEKERKAEEARLAALAVKIDLDAARRRLRQRVVQEKVAA